MTNDRSGHRPGGGLHSKQVTHKPQPKVEPRAKAMNVEGVAQQGAATHFPKKDLYAGQGYNPPVGPTNTLVSGPGGGREIYKSGGQHGLRPAEPMKPGRDTLGEFGPDYKGRS